MSEAKKNVVHDACCLVAVIQDYVADSKKHYTIPAGNSDYKDISINIVNDGIPENNESFIVSIELADNPSLQLRLGTDISQTIVTIQDDDCMCLKICDDKIIGNIFQT